MLPKILKHQIAWSTTVQVIGKAAQLVLGLLALKLVTAALGADEYGTYSKISEYALFFSTAANLGIFGNTIRKMAHAPSDGKLFWNALVLRMVSAGLFLGTGVAVSIFFFHGIGLVWGVLFYATSLFLDYITSVCDGMLQANYRMGRATIALVAGRVLNLGLLILLSQVFLQTRAPLFFIAPLAASILTAALSLAFVRQKIFIVFKLDAALLRSLFWTSLPFGIINIFNSLYFRFLPSFFAAKILSDSLFGGFNISVHLSSTLSLLSTFLMFSSLPALKRNIQDKNLAAVRHLLKPLKIILALAGILITIFGSLSLPFIIQNVFGKSFLPSTWSFVLPLLLILASISYFYDLILITLFAFEQDIWLLKREGLALLSSLCIISLALTVASPHLSLALILTSAILAESLMVFWGLRKIHLFLIKS